MGRFRLQTLVLRAGYFALLPILRAGLPGLGRATVGGKPNRHIRLWWKGAHGADGRG